jgi:hypothetical protein
VVGASSRRTLVTSHPVEFSGWSRSRISIQPFEPSKARRPINGVASAAPSMAVAPLSNPIVIDSVSPFAKSLPSLASRAQTLIGRPSSAIEISIMWMPVAESGPTGFTLFDNRQFSRGNFRNLSWLKLPSSSSGLPNSPEANRLRISITAGSNRRSCPMPNWTPAVLTAAIAVSASAAVVHNGFSQNT